VIWRAACWLAAALSTPCFAHQGQIDVGLGGESQSAPLVRIDPQGVLLDLGLRQRLRGEHLRLDLQGLLDSAPADGPQGLGALLAGSASIKRAPSQPDFDLRVLSLQPSLQRATPLGTFGLGLQWQRIDAADRFARSTRGVQLSWTRAQDSGFTTALIDIGRQRHGSEFADLDARSRSWMLQQHLQLDSGALNSLDLALIGAREANLRGFDELSNRTQLVQGTLQGQAAGWRWSAGLAWQRARFDASAFFDDDVRRDRAWMLDGALSHPLGDQLSLRLTATAQVNKSNTRLYDNRYRQWGLALRAAW
jgi:hypothetical protein